MMLNQLLKELNSKLKFSKRIITKEIVVSIESVEEKKDGFLYGITGYGETKEEAIKDLCKKLSNKLLVKDAYQSTRKEFQTEEITVEEKMKVRDQFGTEIKAGDYITYPGRFSSTIYMRFGKVVGFIESQNKFIPNKLKVITTSNDKKIQSKIVYIQNIDLTTVLEGAAKSAAKSLLEV